MRESKDEVDLDGETGDNKSSLLKNGMSTGDKQDDQEEKKEDKDKEQEVNFFATTMQDATNDDDGHFADNPFYMDTEENDDQSQIKRKEG